MSMTHLQQPLPSWLIPAKSGGLTFIRHVPRHRSFRPIRLHLMRLIEEGTLHVRQLSFIQKQLSTTISIQRSPSSQASIPSISSDFINSVRLGCLTTYLVTSQPTESFQAAFVRPGWWQFRDPLHPPHRL
jgi:hypothetical protein